MDWRFWICPFIVVLMSQGTVLFVYAFDCGNENDTVLKVCADSFHEGRVAYIDFRNAQNSSELSCRCDIRTIGNITDFKLLGMQVWEIPEDPSCGSEVVFQANNDATYIRCTTNFPTKFYHIKTGFSGSVTFNRLSRPFSSNYCIKFTSGYSNSSFQCYDPTRNSTSPSPEPNPIVSHDDNKEAMVTGVALSIALVFVGTIALIVFTRIWQKSKQRDRAKKQMDVIPNVIYLGNNGAVTPHDNDGVTPNGENPPPIYDEISDYLHTDFENSVNERLGTSYEIDDTDKVFSGAELNRTKSERYTKDPLPCKDLDDGYVTPISTQDSQTVSTEFETSRQQKAN